MISRIESGASNARVDTLFRILAALELEMTVQPREKPSPQGGEKS